MNELKLLLSTNQQPKSLRNYNFKTLTYMMNQPSQKQLHSKYLYSITKSHQDKIIPQNSFSYHQCSPEHSDHNHFQHTKTSMFRYRFKEFEQTNGENCPSDSQVECPLDDHMFKCFIHWYVAPNNSIDKEKQSLQNLAKEFDVVLCLWRIAAEDGQNFNMIDLKAIHDLIKIPDFLDKALQVSRPTFMSKKFKVLSICIINKYGSFEAQKCYSVCQKCGEQERLNECCGQFICPKCFKGNCLQSCQFCNKKLDVCPIPLETVEIEQSRRIYQPMFPQLGLEERIELMDMIECEFDYN